MAMEHIWPPMAMAGFDAQLQVTGAVCRRLLHGQKAGSPRSLPFEPRHSFAHVVVGPHGLPLLPKAASPHAALRKLLHPDSVTETLLPLGYGLPLAGDPSTGDRDFYFLGYRLRLERPELALLSGTPGQAQLSWQVWIVETWKETEESAAKRAAAKAAEKTGPTPEEMGFDKNVMIKLYGVDPMAFIEDEMFEGGPEVRSQTVGQATATLRGDLEARRQAGDYAARIWLDFDLSTLSVDGNDEVFVALQDFGIAHTILSEIESVVGDSVPITPAVSPGGRLRAHERNPAHVAPISAAGCRVIPSGKAAGPVLALALTRKGAAGGQLGWLSPITGADELAYAVGEEWIAQSAAVRWQRSDTPRQLVDEHDVEVTLNGQPSPAVARIRHTLDDLDEVVLEAGAGGGADSLEAAFDMTVQLLEVRDTMGDVLSVDDDWKKPEPLPFLLRALSDEGDVSNESSESRAYHRKLARTLFEAIAQPFLDAWTLSEGLSLVSAPTGTLFLNARLTEEDD